MLHKVNEYLVITEFLDNLDKLIEAVKAHNGGIFNCYVSTFSNDGETIVVHCGHRTNVDKDHDISFETVDVMKSGNGKIQLLVDEAYKRHDIWTENREIDARIKELKAKKRSLEETSAKIKDGRLARENADSMSVVGYEIEDLERRLVVVQKKIDDRVKEHEEKDV